jgi:hypothetical protein
MICKCRLYVRSRDQKLAERYVKNWLEHAKHPEVYLGRGDKGEFEVPKGPKGPQAGNVRLVG